MNKLIKKFERDSGLEIYGLGTDRKKWESTVEKFAEMVILECIEKIETYRIPVGNSAAGEMACEWTYDALIQIRDEIKETFSVDNE